MNSKNCIIFDCDGVLVDSEPLAARAYQKVYSDSGLAIAASVMQDCIGLKQIDIITKIAEMTGHYLPLEQHTQIWPETRKLFELALKPTQEIEKFLSLLTQSRCVASSSSLERINLSLGLTGLIDYFEPRIFSSSMVRNGKPAPDLFIFAAQQMGYAPRNCVVIEDSFLGVKGAVAAGMTAIGFVGGTHSDSQTAQKLSAYGAAAICASWQEVADTLATLNYRD